MFRKKQLQSFNQIYSVPTQYNKRHCTDIFCLIFGLVYSLVLIILAAVLFNYNNFYKANFPADSNGNLCGIDKQAYPYIYFANAPNIDRRVCVKSCPKAGDQQLSCVPTQNIGCLFSNSKGFEVIFYDSQPVSTRSQEFCMPKDQNLKQKILQNSQLQNRNMFYNSQDTIILSFFVAMAFAVLFMLLVQLLPKPMNIIAVVLGCIAILAASICIFLYSTQANGFKIVIGCLFVFALLIILCTVMKNMNSLKMHGIFLDYATKFFKARIYILAYLLIFFVLLIGLAAMIILQFTAYWSSGNINFDPKTTLFHQLGGGLPITLTVFLAIQAIWGLAFLKLAFNFCISGQAAGWYFNKQANFGEPFKLLICKHLGSVIGGAFIIAFLTPFDFLFDFFKPSKLATQNSFQQKIRQKVCCGCESVLDLVRTDSMAYIYLTGNPFCNSARYCQYLCQKSIITDYSQSVSRVYRLCSHLLIVGIIIIFAMYVKGIISIYALIVIVVTTIFVSTFPISLHADAAEAVQIIFLVDQQLGKRNKTNTIRNEQVYDFQDNFNGVLHTQLINQIKNERIRQNQKKENTRI